MDVERLRTFLLTLPHVTETVQWGGSLVLWVGDKAIGGKMFAVISLNDPVEGRTPQVMAYAAGPARFPDLLEREGLYPAPYLARAHWIAVEDWQVFSHVEWESELRQAHAVILDKLPPRLRTILSMPRTAQRRILHDARQERSRKQQLGPSAALPAKKARKVSVKRPLEPRQTVPGKRSGTPRSGRPPAK